MYKVYSGLLRAYGFEPDSEGEDHINWRRGEVTETCLIVQVFHDGKWEHNNVRGDTSHTLAGHLDLVTTPRLFHVRLTDSLGNDCSPYIGWGEGNCHGHIDVSVWTGTPGSDDHTLYMTEQIASMLNERLEKDEEFRRRATLPPRERA